MRVQINIKDHVVINDCEGIRHGSVEISELLDDVLAIVDKHLLKLLCGNVAMAGSEVNSVWN